MIQNLKVRGFKSIKEMDLELRNINILIGANGSGKSNLLDVFDFLRNIWAQNLQKESLGVVNSLLFGGQKKTKEVKFGLTLLARSRKFAYDITLCPTSDFSSLKVENENLSFADSDSSRAGSSGFYYSQSQILESELRNSGRYVEMYALKQMLKIRKYHFHDVGKDALVKGDCPVSDGQNLKSDAQNLAAFLKRLKDEHESSYKQIIQTIRLIAPFFDDFVFEPKNDKIRLCWLDKNFDDTPFYANSLSDGTLRFACLATLLLQPFELMPDTIIIDEPELGLHPAALEILSELIKSVSLQKQVIISTHSVELLNYFDYKDLVVCQRDRKTGESKFKRVENSEFLQECLKDMSLSEVWNSNFLGGRP